jgi:hypothetical protein
MLYDIHKDIKAGLPASLCCHVDQNNHQLHLIPEKYAWKVALRIYINIY